MLKKIINNAPKKTGALLEFEKCAADSYRIIVIGIPQDLENKQWKELFTQALAPQKPQKASVLLDALIDTYLKKGGRDEESFLRSTLKIIAPSMKTFERDVMRSKKLLGVYQCKCCQAGRYHFELATEQNIAHGERQQTLGSKTSNPFMRFVIKMSSLKSYYVHQFQPKNLTKQDFYEAIFVLAHEMAHVARLDDDREATLVQSQEFQADLLALLILQDEEYFRATMRFFCTTAITQQELLFLYLLINKNNYDALTKFITLYGNETQNKALASAPSEKAKQEYLLRYAEQQQKLLHEHQQQSSHPFSLDRLDRTLNTWAAYLIHVKNVPLLGAIEAVFSQSTAIIKSLNINTNDVVSSKLLTDILAHWKTNTLQLPEPQTSSPSGSLSPSTATSSGDQFDFPSYDDED